MSGRTYKHILNVPSPDGSPLEVTYSPDDWYVDGHEFKDYAHDHFELRGAIASETGYRSHFVLAKTVGNPVEYAKAFVAERLKERIAQGYKPGQTDLFA